MVDRQPPNVQQVPCIGHIIVIGSMHDWAGERPWTTPLNFDYFALQSIDLPPEHMRIVLERCYNDLRLLSVPNKTLKAEGFFRSNKVSAAFCSLPGLQLDLRGFPTILYLY